MTTSTRFHPPRPELRKLERLVTWTALQLGNGGCRRSVGALLIWSLGWAQSACGAFAPHADQPPQETPPAETRAHERSARWDSDLDLLRDVFLAADRSYTAETRAIARLRLESLRVRLPKLADTEVVVELARIAALAGNAHTRAYVLRNRGVWQRYPLRLWKFDDGWRVVAAQGIGQALVGGRLLRIGSRPIEEVAAAVRPLFAGNKSWADYMATYTLSSPEALASAGVPIDGGRVLFEVEAADGATRKEQLAPSPRARRDTPEESWWYLSPTHPASVGWTHALSPASLPEMLRGGGRWYRSLRCSGNVLYAQFTRAEDEPGQPTVAQWGEGLLAAVEARPPRFLVLDLRCNTGGDLEKAQLMLQSLAKSELGQAKGRIVVLSGVNTFSAGITPLAYLRARSSAVVMGRAPGDEPDFWAEGGNVELPHSRTILHFADRLHAYSDRPVPPGVQEFLSLGIDVRDLKPDRQVQWLWSEYIQGIDPDVEAAIDEPLRCEGSS